MVRRRGMLIHSVAVWITIGLRKSEDCSHINIKATVCKGILRDIYYHNFCSSRNLKITHMSISSRKMGVHKYHETLYKCKKCK